MAAEADRPNFEFPFILEPLEPLREYVTVVSGLRNKGGEGGAARNRRRDVAELRDPRTETPRRARRHGRSVAARHLTKDTTLPSMELCGEPGGMISFRTPDQPLPMEGNPRKVFFSMFGQGRDERGTSGDPRHDDEPARLREGVHGEPEPQARRRRPRPR